MGDICRRRNGGDKYNKQDILFKLGAVLSGNSLDIISPLQHISIETIQSQG